MAKFEVDLGANTRRFQAGVQDAERELSAFADVLEDIADTSGKVEDRTRDAMRGAADGADDAARAMLDLEGDTERAGRAGERAGDDTERALRNAERKTDDLADRFRDAARKADDLGDAGKGAGDDVRRGMDRAEDGLAEFRDEANSTARESAASFDGSAESIVDAFQEIAANAFAGWGPAGAAAGLAIAAGVGLATAAFGENAEALERSKERAAEWAQAFIDAGGRVLDSQQRVAMLQDIVTDPERWTEAQDNAREWGVSVSTAMRAMTGDTVALAEANESLAEREAAARENALGLADSGEALADVLGGATAATRNGRAALDALEGELATGRDAADAYNQSLIETARDAEGAAASVDEFGNRVYALPDGSTVTVNAETGVASHNVEALADDIRNVPDGSATVRVGVERAALDRYMRQNLDRRANVTLVTRAGRMLTN